MPFPNSKRVIYEMNPLIEVICQIRFPPILKIETEIPSIFQETVRNDYPLFNENLEFLPSLPKEIGDQIPSEILRLSETGTSRKNYEFISSDEIWKINLTRNFLALSTKRYTRWEEFKNKLLVPYKALLETYAPTYFTRIGLRYRDLIMRSKLGLVDVSWSELIKPYLLGILLDNEVNNSVVNLIHNTEILLADGYSFVRLSNGLVKDINSEEIAFMIDSDFYNTDKTEKEKVLDKLEFFNQRGSRLIQWAITDRLHNAMNPKEI